MGNWMAGLKRTGYVRLLAGLVALLSAGPLAADTSIGVVDTRQVFSSWDEVKDFDTALRRDFGDRDVAIKELRHELASLQQRVNSDGAMMSPGEKSQLAAQFQDKKGRYEELVRDTKQELAELRRAFMVDRESELKQVIAALAQEHGLDLVVRAEAVFFARPDMDLTQKLIEKLNQ